MAGRFKKVCPRFKKSRDASSAARRVPDPSLRSGCRLLDSGPAARAEKSSPEQSEGGVSRQPKQIRQTICATGRETAADVPSHFVRRTAGDRSIKKIRAAEAALNRTE
jgi:hypothetical protein